MPPARSVAHYPTGPSFCSIAQRRWSRSPRKMMAFPCQRGVTQPSPRKSSALTDKGGQGLAVLQRPPLMTKWAAPPPAGQTLRLDGRISQSVSRLLRLGKKLMLRAVVSHGEIHPLEPLPPDWHEGQRLRVERADDNETPISEIERDFAVLTAMCQDSDPAEEEHLERGLQEARRHPKDQVSRQMGLP